MAVLHIVFEILSVLAIISVLIPLLKTITGHSGFLIIQGFKNSFPYYTYYSLVLPISGA
jgi:hypothetical protein